MEICTFRYKCVSQTSSVIRGREVKGFASFDIFKIKALIRVLKAKVLKSAVDV